MSGIRIKFLVICTVVVMAAQLAMGQASDPGKSGRASSVTFNKITTAELQLLLKDLIVSNPKALRDFAADPGSRKKQLANLRELLAFASQAQKDGLADDPINRQELENVRSEIVAVNYDKEINKSRAPLPPFGYISDARVNAFWSAAGTAKAREDEFQRFINSKVELLKSGDPQMRNRVLSDEEKDQARDFFAKIEICQSAYEAKKATLPKEFRDNVNLKIKLQQAQFLARLYAEKSASEIIVTDEEIDKYIAGQPELDTSQKKAKAEKILGRAKAGEDFAKLANEFSEDPGNKGANGNPHGGLYQDVRVGTMVAPFERAALALQAGEVSPKVVETDFGYHIIKLEKRGKNPADPNSEIYDVRHILISTMFTDPADPTGSGKPIVQYVRSKLEAAKEKQLLDKVVAANNIQVPDDFTVPKIGPTTSTAKKAKRSPTKRPVKKRR